ETMVDLAVDQIRIDHADNGATILQKNTMHQAEFFQQLAHRGPVSWGSLGKLEDFEGAIQRLHAGLFLGKSGLVDPADRRAVVYAALVVVSVQLLREAIRIALGLREGLLECRDRIRLGIAIGGDRTGRRAAT